MTNEKVLGRVRALLAKAESTTFPEEAEALTAKAQELIGRYSIDEAMATSPRRNAGGPILRAVVVPAPYASAKTSLLGAVALANRCRVVIGRDRVTAIGYAADLEVVELLFTSLLVQASVAMHAADESQLQGRTKAFRHAFLLAFAARIGARLRESQRSAEHEAAATHGAALVPVLTKRLAAVDTAVTDAFGPLGRKRVSASHGQGWRAGAAAADRATLNSGFGRLAR